MTAFGSVEGGWDAAGTGARARHSWLASDLGSVTGGRWAKGKGADGTHPVPVAAQTEQASPARNIMADPGHLNRKHSTKACTK
jgi:hypothetical protein